MKTSVNIHKQITLIFLQNDQQDSGFLFHRGRKECIWSPGLNSSYFWHTCKVSTQFVFNGRNERFSSTLQVRCPYFIIFLSVIDFSVCKFYYRNSFPVTVPAEVNEQLEQVKNEMKFSEKDSKIISAFTVYGFNILHLGTTWFRTGVLVGLPANFSYKQPSDVDKKMITVQQLNWFTFYHIFKSICFFVLNSPGRK